MDPPKRTQSAGIIERSDGAVLICRRLDSPHWQFPRGDLLGPESPEAAVRRAAREGVGLDVSVAVGQPPVVEQRGAESVMVRYFICHIRSGEATPRGYDEVRWILPGQLCEYDFDASTQKVVEWYIA